MEMTIISSGVAENIFWSPFIVILAFLSNSLATLGDVRGTSTSLLTVHFTDFD